MDPVNEAREQQFELTLNHERQNPASLTSTGRTAQLLGCESYTLVRATTDTATVPSGSKRPSVLQLHVEGSRGPVQSLPTRASQDETTISALDVRSNPTRELEAELEGASTFEKEDLTPPSQNVGNLHLFF